MSTPNPFRPYPKQRGYLKIFIYGEPGTLKTRRAMGLPHPLAIIDMEDGAGDYQDLAGDDDLYMLTRSVTDLEAGISWIEANPGKVATVILDPITVLWQQIQQGHVARALKKGKRKIGGQWVEVNEPEEVAFEVQDWGRLKTHHGAILTRLLNLPCHVVMIARGGEKRDEKGNVKGWGFDGEKSIPFLAKVVVETHRDHDVVIKDRFTGTFADSERIMGRVDFNVFLKASGTVQRQMQQEDKAAEDDARAEAGEPQEPAHHPSWESDRVRFCAALGQLSVPLTYDESKAICARIRHPAGKPSVMDQEARSKFLTWLDTPAGMKALSLVRTPEGGAK